MAKQSWPRYVRSTVAILTMAFAALALATATPSAAQDPRPLTPLQSAFGEIIERDFPAERSGLRRWFQQHLAGDSRADRTGASFLAGFINRNSRLAFRSSDQTVQTMMQMQQEHALEAISKVDASCMDDYVRPQSSIVELPGMFWLNAMAEGKRHPVRRPPPSAKDRRDLLAKVHLPEMKPRVASFERDARTRPSKRPRDICLVKFTWLNALLQLPPDQGARLFTHAGPI